MSAILIGLVISVFSFLYSQIRKETDLLDDIENIFILERFLDVNTLKCDSINVEENRLKFYEEGIFYRSLDLRDGNIIINAEEAIDTLNLVSSDLWYSRNSSGNKPTSQIRFNIISESLITPIIISKEYEGVVLVNPVDIENEY